MTSWCKHTRYPPLPIQRSFSRELVELSETSAPSDTWQDEGWCWPKHCLLGMGTQQKMLSCCWNGAFSPHIWSALDLVSPPSSWTARGFKVLLLSQQALGSKSPSASAGNVQPWPQLMVTSLCMANPTRHFCNLKFVGICTIPPKIEMLTK